MATTRLNVKLATGRQDYGKYLAITVNYCRLGSAQQMGTAQTGHFDLNEREL